MTNRRVQISNIARDGDKAFAGAEGMAGEEFDTQVFQLHGFSSTPEDAAETVLLEQNGDADNHISLPPEGDRIAGPGTTLIYYGDDTEILLDAGSIKIRVGGSFLNIENGTLETDLDIQTSGTIQAQGAITSAAEVTAGGTNLTNHIHTGVTAGMGVSGPPQ